MGRIKLQDMLDIFQNFLTFVKFNSYNCYLFIFFIYVSECQNYVSLNADRKITYTPLTTVIVYCDSRIGPGWFRFEGSAGIRIATSCQPTKRCGTHITSWMNGGHPSVADGRSAGRCVSTGLQVAANFQQILK